MIAMNVILFTDSLGAGGAQRQLVGLARLLNNYDYSIKVCTYYDQSFYKKDLDNHGIPNLLLSKASNKFLRLFILLKFFKDESPDWVIAYQETPSLFACLCKILGCRFRLIVSERNTTQTLYLRDHVRFFLYRFANKIVPNSYTQELFLRKHYSYMNHKISTITNFVDTDFFVPQLHLPSYIPKIIVVASIWPPKNTKLFLQACHLLNSRGVKYQVNWYGRYETQSAYSRECDELINQYSLENVALLPKTDQIIDRYHEADFFCLPSFYEGTPNVLCEAISCGLPAIVSNVCDNSRYVIEQYNGLLFDPNSPEDIASKVERMLSIDSKTYSTYSENSRSLAVRQLSKMNFFQKYNEILLSK